MPRTEKKFGQLNQTPSGSPSQLVPVSQTKRNVLINLSTRSTDTVTSLVTTTGVIQRQFTSGTMALGSGDAFLSGTTGAGTIGASFFGPLFWQLPSGPGSTQLMSFRVSGSDVYEYYGGSFSNTTGALTLGAQTSLNATYTANFWPLGDGTFTGVTLTNVKITGNNARIFTPLGFWFFHTGTANTPYFTLISPYEYADAGANRIAMTYSANQGLTAPVLSWTPSTLGKGPGTVAEVKILGVYPLRGKEATNNRVVFMTGLSRRNATGASTSEALAFTISSGTAELGRIWWDAGQSGNAQQIQSFFHVQDYSAGANAWAFSSSNQENNPWYGTNASAGSGTGFSSIMPYLPVGVAPAGFRIVSDDGTINTNRSFLDGTTYYPPAPTGVDVPTYAEMESGSFTSAIAAIKFNPSGNRVAVAYNRDYSGSGIAKSVVVVYKKQNDGTWAHEASSGSNLPVYPRQQSEMEWLSDGSGVVIASASQGRVYLWTCGFSDVTQSLTLSSVSSAMAGEYPAIPSMADAPIAGSFTFTNSGSSVAMQSTPNYVSAVYSFSRGASYPPEVVVVKGYNSSQSVSNYDTPILAEKFTAATYAVTGSVSNYVNTVASNILIRSGTVTQLSNIILDPGEGIYIEPETNGTIEAVAYGVEIT